MDNNDKKEKLKTLKNMTFGERLIHGMEEALEDAKDNKKKMRNYIREITPKIRKFNKDEIKELRLSLLCTQVMFANMLGVQPNTVEKWESGITKPSGTALRILALIKNKQKIFLEEDLKVMG